MFRPWLILFVAAAGACSPAPRPAFAAAPAAAPAAIRIANYADQDEIRFPVPLILGETADKSVTEITVVNTSSDRPERQTRGLAHQGRFKALVELVPGVNQLVLRAGPAEQKLTLRYRPQTNPYFVRAIYLTDRSGETAYQTPRDNDPQDYAARIGTALKLMQTFTAERLHDLGFGRRTFNLEFDERGQVIVHVHRGALPAEKYYALDDLKWYDAVYKELREPFPMRSAKNFCVAAYTRFDPKSGKTRGHTALGGGGLGLFGSGNLYTWPASIAQAQAAFMNPAAIDTTRTMNDSAGRGTWWGAASTTIGASLHEMGHTFGLPHTREPLDIMTRGFDRFNRAFTLTEPASGRGKTPVEFKPERVAAFAPISAAALVNSRWLALDERPWRDHKPTIRRDRDTGDIVVEDETAVRYVGLSVKGEAVHFIAPPTGQKQVRLPAGVVKEKAGQDPFRIRAINDQGNTTLRPGDEL